MVATYIKKITRTLICVTGEYAKEEPPVCVACGTMITFKHILTECADLAEVRKKYFEEKSLYSFLRNANPEKTFDFLREIGVFHRILSLL